MKSLRQRINDHHKTFTSNVKTDVLFKKLDLDSQWHAMNDILSLLTEKQKVQIRKKLRKYKKESNA